MPRLTERQKKRLIADRADGMSYRNLARKYKISRTTAQRYCESAEPEICQLVTLKKEEAVKDMLTYMESKSKDFQEIIDLYTTALRDPRKISGASLKELATAFGIVVDKASKNEGAGFGSAKEDDPLSAALKEEAERLNNGNK